MRTNKLGAAFGGAIMMVLCVLLASPAAAQVGTLRGRVVDEAGKPIADAQVVFQTKDDPKFRVTAKTNAKGEYIQAGLTSAKAAWSVSATKDGVTAGIANIDVPYKNVAEVPDLVLRAAKAAPPLNMGSSTPGRDAEKLKAELGKTFEEASAALSANSYDVAIAKFNEIIAKLPTCDICYLRIGDVSVKKGDLAAAEAAYKKAIEVEPKSAEAYENLASVYNTQKKYADAGEASKKATELRSALGASGDDATSFYNAGVIFWNQSKAVEAAEQFAKAIKADPSMADAHYYYGMALINQGKVPEAKTELQQYLKLAPTGQYADTAKSILGSL